MTSLTSLYFRHLIALYQPIRPQGIRNYHSSAILRKPKYGSKDRVKFNRKSLRKADRKRQRNQGKTVAPGLLSSRQNSTTKVLGTKRSRFTREALLASSKRAPLFFLVLYLVYNDNEYMPTFPFSILAMSGPSMLPTIHPAGELYLRNNFSHRLPESFRRDWKVGDVIVILDYKGEFACKRIVALGGDEVLRFGEFAPSRYRNLKDYGATSVENEEIFMYSPLPEWNRDLAIKSEGDEQEQKVIIPPGYVWVEGDNPIFSVDSRHYGPVPIDNITGRVIYRIWPRRRDGHGDSCYINTIRPIPPDNIMSQNYALDVPEIVKK